MTKTKQKTEKQCSGKNTKPYNVMVDFGWYLVNQKKLVKKYDGKVLVIRNKKVLGAFPDRQAAYEGSASVRNKCLIQHCTQGDFAYMLRSRSYG